MIGHKLPVVGYKVGYNGFFPVVIVCSTKRVAEDTMKVLLAEHDGDICGVSPVSFIIEGRWMMCLTYAEYGAFKKKNNHYLLTEENHLMYCSCGGYRYIMVDEEEIERDFR